MDELKCKIELDYQKKAEYDAFKIFCDMQLDKIKENL